MYGRDVLSFILILADLDKELAKKRKGEVEIREKRLFALAYADDLVLIAQEERGKLLVEEFRRYVSKKKLEMNPEKSTVVRFGRRAGIKRKREWKWGKSEIKEVNEFSLPRFYFPKKWESKCTHKGKSEESRKNDERSMRNRKECQKKVVVV